MELTGVKELTGGIELPEGMELTGGMQLTGGIELPGGMELTGGIELPGGIKVTEGMELTGGMELMVARSGWMRKQIERDREENENWQCQIFIKTRRLLSRGQNYLLQFDY